MFGKKKKEGNDHLKNPEDFETNVKLLIWLGYIYDGSTLSKIRILMAAFSLYAFPLQLLVKVPTLPLTKALFSIVVTLIFAIYGASLPFTIYNSRAIIELGDQVREGFVKYSEPWTTEERQILSTTNDSVIKNTKNVMAGYIVVTVLSAARALFQEQSQRNDLGVPVWLPWDLDSGYKYAMGQLYLDLLLVNTVFYMAGSFITYTYFRIVYEGQFRLLTAHYLNTIPPNLPKIVTHNDENKRLTLTRLQDCVRHHVAIKQLHSDFLNYFGVKLFLMRLFSTLILCMFCYILSVGVTFEMLSNLSSAGTVLIFLFLHCLIGEKFAEVSEQWRNVVYEVEWWNQPVEVQKRVFMIQIGSQKSLPVYGLWKVVKFSHLGLSAMLQEAMAFYNMLKAVKG